MSTESRICRHCSDHNWAIWRCIDCTLSTPVCRKCMRFDHRENPLHRIECWTGTHFRRAELWEVGTYLLVPHQLSTPICDSLEFNMTFLETFQIQKDSDEQMKLRDKASASAPAPPSEDRTLPQADALNNTYVRIVHINGIHHLAMVACQCRGADCIPLDLMASRLMPASFTRIRTLFSLALLDYFRLCNLELKASAYQFDQLLRRLTLPIGTAEIPNLYHEFRRMGRLWRWMKKLKWAGYGHNQQDPMQPPPGSLANFCPACPQPGINLPDDWKDDENGFAFQRIFVADGNFKADHVRQKSAQEDFWLLDGAGMAPNRAEYLEFLRTAIERLTVSPCENTFRAIMNALLASKACDITGLVALVCARHGFYVPNALVDLFKGEQQKNVDFAFLKALDSTRVDPQQGVMLIYDIACQYSVHLRDRIGHLLPVGLQVDRAIDHFHVHAHKDECYFRYATTFIPGAGIVKGQILESNWSILNKISPTARTATLAHRTEMLDDHACDSNHKKTLAMTATLCSRSLDAKAMVAQTDKYYAELSATVDSQMMNTWENEVLGVEAMRLANVKAMDIYAARVPDRQEQLHEALAPLLVKLKQLKEAAEITDKRPEMPSIDEDEAEFDEAAEEISGEETPAPTLPSTDMIPVERQQLSLPSNGNVGGDLKHVEISARKKQAHAQLNRLRELVADISFQYSHVIRAAPERLFEFAVIKMSGALGMNLSSTPGYIRGAECDWYNWVVTQKPYGYSEF
ncbi:hypothetical protein BDZ97DRAFT_1667832 [Flammula alnicola]|nr:hypothetical protein BDZ97DRAFT_1667832 [Flammula alnicola]